MHLEMSSGEFFGKIAIFRWVIPVLRHVARTKLWSEAPMARGQNGMICIKPVAGLAQQHSQECKAERHGSSRLFFA